MLRRTVEILSGVALGAASVAVLWYLLTPPIQSPFDANGDNRISYTEFRAFAASLFEQIDSNLDGGLEQTERRVAASQFRPSLSQAITAILRVHRLDRNKDGLISKAEYFDPSSLQTVFDQLDKDHDRSLTRGEGADLAFKLLFP